MSNKPKIYGYCDAGCQWETVHKSDFEKSASMLKVDADADGVYRLDASQKYRICGNVDKYEYSDGAFPCRIYIERKEQVPATTTTYIADALFGDTEVINGKNYCDAQFLFVSAEFNESAYEEAGVLHNASAVFDIDGSRVFGNVENWYLDSDTLENVLLCVENATEVYLVNSDAEIKMVVPDGYLMNDAEGEKAVAICIGNPNTEVTGKHAVAIGGGPKNDGLTGQEHPYNKATGYKDISIGSGAWCDHLNDPDPEPGYSMQFGTGSNHESFTGQIGGYNFPLKKLSFFQVDEDPRSETTYGSFRRIATEKYIQDMISAPQGMIEGYKFKLKVLYQSQSGSIGVCAGFDDTYAGCNCLVVYSDSDIYGYITAKPTWNTSVRQEIQHSADLPVIGTETPVTFEVYQFGATSYFYLEGRYMGMIENYPLKSDNRSMPGFGIFVSGGDYKIYEAEVSAIVDLTPIAILENDTVKVVGIDATITDYPIYSLERDWNTVQAQSLTLPTGWTTQSAMVTWWTNKSTDIAGGTKPTAQSPGQVANTAYVDFNFSGDPYLRFRNMGGGDIQFVLPFMPNNWSAVKTISESWSPDTLDALGIGKNVPLVKNTLRVGSKESQIESVEVYSNTGYKKLASEEFVNEGMSNLASKTWSDNRYLQKSEATTIDMRAVNQTSFYSAKVGKTPYTLQLVVTSKTTTPGMGETRTDYYVKIGNQVVDSAYTYTDYLGNVTEKDFDNPEFYSVNLQDILTQEDYYNSYKFAIYVEEREMYLQMDRNYYGILHLNTDMGYIGITGDGLDYSEDNSFICLKIPSVTLSKDSEYYKNYTLNIVKL